MKKRVLIVEDDANISSLQKDYLEISGHEVTICSDGLSGLKCIREEEFDILVLDIMLPKMDGFEILRQVRDEMDIPILLVSAKKEDIDKIRGLGLGADDYITKPFSPSELVARVDAHIAKYDRLRKKFSGDTGQDTDSLVIRGLEIQKQAHRVFVNGKEVGLAQKEFELLLYLALNPNRVFGREDLFEKIWGIDSLGDSATVTVHIARIRDKIEKNPSKPEYIETVWGTGGYRFKNL
jgi:two-component system OmpR family response regulator